MAPKLSEHIKKQLIDAIYPVLIPWEQQCMQVQAENYKIMEKVAKNVWKTFLKECEKKR